MREVFADAKKRIPGRASGDETRLSPAEVIERLIAEKRAEWEGKGIAPGLIERALNWAMETSNGWASRFPPERRGEIVAEVYPSFLEDAENKYIKAILKALYEPEVKER